MARMALHSLLMALTLPTARAADGDPEPIPLDEGRTVRLVARSPVLDPKRPDAMEQQILAVDLESVEANIWSGAAGWISTLPPDAESPTWVSEPASTRDILRFRAVDAGSFCPDGSPLTSFQVRTGPDAPVWIELCGARHEALPWQGQAGTWQLWRVAQAMSLLRAAAPSLSALHVAADGARVTWEGENAAGSCELVAPDCAPDRLAGACPLPGGRVLAVVAATGDGSPSVVVLALPDADSRPIPVVKCLRTRLPGLRLGALPATSAPRSPPREQLRQVSPEPL